MSYPVAFRKLVMDYHKEHSLRKTSQQFHIAVSTIQAWKNRQLTTGNLSPVKTKHPPRKLPPEELKKYVQEHPDAYQSEISRKFGCAQSSVNKALKRLGVTRKKTTHYKEQDAEKINAYKQKVANISPKNVVYVDETGIDCCLYREYGCAPRGKKVYGAIAGRKYAHVGIVAAQMGEKIIAPLQYSGTMKHGLFEKWSGEILLPELPKGTVIVMDNAYFHRKKALYLLAEGADCHLIFLPPCTPELNPIEHFWNCLKSTLRRILPQFRANGRNSVMFTRTT